MKNVAVLVAFIVIFGGVIIFVIVSAIKRREITFEGVVIDKNVIENRVNNNNMGAQPNGINIGTMNGGVTHTYKIRVKTDAGKEINYKISEGMYETVKINDRVSKQKGTTEIQILSTSQTAPQPQQPSVSTTPPPPPIPPATPVPSTNPTAPPPPPPVTPPQNTNSQKPA